IDRPPRAGVGEPGVFFSSLCIYGHTEQGGRWGVSRLVMTGRPAGHGKPRPVGEPTPRVRTLGRPAVLSSLSYTTTLRSLSALMILLFSGLSPERTMLINDGVTPFFFAHFFWLPARLTSKRSKRTTSF